MKVDIEQVQAAIRAVRERHTPPATYVGSIYSESVQTCDEIGRAIMALEPNKTAASTEAGVTIDDLIGILERHDNLHALLYVGDCAVMSVALLSDKQGHVYIEMNTNKGE